MGIKCYILRILIVLLRGQKAEIKVINGAISKTAIEIKAMKYSTYHNCCLKQRLKKILWYSTN